MTLINKIIQQSALGPFSALYKRIFLTVFMFIVTLLLVMLFVLLKYGRYMTIKFGY